MELKLKFCLKNVVVTGSRKNNSILFMKTQLTSFNAFHVFSRES